MLSNCANPECGKPLHYLREGRISAFEATRRTDPAGKPWHGFVHYWLCGECSQTLTLVKTMDGVQPVPRAPVRHFARFRPARSAAIS
jgi:hypothetical protein